MDNFETDLQPKEGYTLIPNGLLSLLIKHHFSAGEIRVILLVAKLTHGWHLPNNKISHCDILWKTSFSLRHVKRIVSRLVTNNILIKGKLKYKNNVLSINKDYSSWILWKTNGSINRQVTKIPPEG